MGSSQSKIGGTTLSTTQQHPADTTIIQDFVKGSFASLCHLDASSETLHQILKPLDPDLTVPAPNRFTLKAILKSSKPSPDSGALDSPQSSSKSSVGFYLDPDLESQQNISSPTTTSSSCWSCSRQANGKESFESYSPTSKMSIQSQVGSLHSTRLSTASLSSRRSVENPPIYQSTSGDFYVAFDSTKYVLSNGSICPNSIHIDGQCFASSEHCYLYQKALFHGNKQLANQILVEDDVHEVRKLVKKPFETMSHRDRWRKVQVSIMRRSCMAKFEQNPSLRRELFRTGQATLVAAIPDCRWGVGLEIDDLSLSDPTKWEGSNLLGQVLMAVRTLLASQYIDEYQNEQMVAEKRQQKCIKHV